MCAERGDLSRSVKLNISGASESFVAWLLADLPRLIGGGIVGSMPSNRTQQQTADLFQAAGVQESCRTHTPACLTSAERSAAAVSGAEKLSSRHVLLRDLSNALKQLDDGELDRLLEATRDELQRRGRSLTSTPVNRPTTHVATEQRSSDQSTPIEESPERRQPEEPNVAGCHWHPLRKLASSQSRAESPSTGARKTQGIHSPCRRGSWALRAASEYR
jgi:hypothetical protein